MERNTFVCSARVKHTCINFSRLCPFTRECPFFNSFTNNFVGSLPHVVHVGHQWFACTHRSCLLSVLSVLSVFPTIPTLSYYRRTCLTHPNSFSTPTSLHLFISSFPQAHTRNLSYQFKDSFHQYAHAQCSIQPHALFRHCLFFIRILVICGYFY